MIRRCVLCSAESKQAVESSPCLCGGKFTAVETWYAVASVEERADLADEVLQKLRLLSPEKRQELFANFCIDCAGDDPKCQCWNDE